jgi:hypothetical protein
MSDVSESRQQYVNKDRVNEKVNRMNGVNKDKIQSSLEHSKKVEVVRDC